MPKLLSPSYYSKKITNLITNYQRYGIIKSANATNVDQSMHLFTQKQAMFIHIPKCAGVSLFESLFGDDSFGHHSIEVYKEAYGQKRLDNLYKFSIVREPADRLLSAYNYLKKGGRGRALDLRYQEILSPCQSLEEFVSDWLPRKEIQNFQHFVPQSEFIYDSEDRLLVDDVFRFEELDSLIPTLKQKCPQLVGKTVEEKLARKNQMKKSADISLDDNIRQQIRAHYARDCQLLNY
ncbi:MAG: sulfotransferase family 2 domain-containing protein [Pseudomonadota bacterium]|nr:sulfotransferase family 2 domain-containing protein [Pseudomonadota bacterium]